MIPAPEKFIPAFRSVVTVALLASLAFSDANAGSPDYEAGRKAYLGGDVIGAMGILRKVADTGDADAQALLGFILDKAEFDEEAVSYLQKSSDQGNAEGTFRLATMYIAGEGVGKDLARGAQLLRKAAALGHDAAKRTLVMAYIERNEAMDASDQTSEEARRLLLEAANTEYIPAMEALASAYATGAFGLAADPAKAKEWKDKITEVRVAGKEKAEKERERELELAKKKAEEEKKAKSQ